MSNPLRWRICYDEGPPLDNLICPNPRDIPIEKRWGVVAIVQRSALRNKEVCCGPWLYYMRGKWWCTDGNDNGVGIIDRWVHSAHEIECCLPGRWISDDEWNAIKIAADNDPDFGAPMLGRR